MSETPELKLNPLPTREPNSGRGPAALLVVVLLLQAAILWVALRPPDPTSDSPDRAPLKELALKLEDKSLAREAAREWERYLDAAPDDPDRANIAYRAGKLRMEAGDYGEAARNLVAAELAGFEGKDIGPKIVDCLRKLGLYGEVGRELSRRVNIGETEGVRVLATYAGEKITDKDLDRMVERRVEGIIGGDETQREAVLKQLNTTEARKTLLREFLQTELLARRARETWIHREDEYRDALALAEQGILAGAFLNREIGAIRPTPVDIESFYEANKDNYKNEDDKEPPPFNEVRDRVVQDYVARKRAELSQQLMRDLMSRYDVRILDE